MHVLNPPTRLIALLLAIVLAASACSSGSDDAAAETDASPAAESSGDESSDDSAEATDAAAISCEAAEEASFALRGANGWVPQVVDAETHELIGSSDDGASALAAIETLRPVQDIEGPLGSMREGLDNLEADIIAINEGRYDDKVGDYSIAAMNAVLAEEVC